MRTLRYPKHRFVVAAVACLLIALLLFSLMGYANQTTLPKGTTFLGQPVEGIRTDHFREILKAYEQSWLTQSVAFTATEHSPEKKLPLRNLGLTTDIDEMVKNVESLHKGSIWQRVKYRWQMRNRAFIPHWSINRTMLKQTINETWKELQQKQPIDAKRVITASDQVEYVPGREAYRIDEAQLEKMLNEKFSEVFPYQNGKPIALTLKPPLRTIVPKVQLDDLKAQGIRRKMIQFSTRFNGKEEGRTHNISTTAQNAHDLLLQPGETFDFAKIVSVTEKLSGYRPAPVIYNGKIVPGIGGGICQVSSTLYNAALRSGLEIVERKNHSLPVSYVPLGQDATFSQGYINFKFRNNTKYYILIRTSVEKDTGQITVKLFGGTPENVTYDIESSMVETIQPPIKYVKNPDLPPDTQKVLDSGKQGFVVETYRVKKENGDVVQRELISKDTYKAQPTVIARNSGNNEDGSDTAPPSPQPSPKKPILEDGLRGPVF